MYDKKSKRNKTLNLSLEESYTLIKNIINFDEFEDKKEVDLKL